MIPDLLLRGYSAALTGDRTVGVPLLRRAIAALLERELPTGIGRLLLGGRAAGDLMDHEALNVLAARGVQRARAAGARTMLPLALNLLGVSGSLSGQFTEAQACHTEAFEVSAVTGNSGVLGTAAREDVFVLA